MKHTPYLVFLLSVAVMTALCGCAENVEMVEFQLTASVDHGTKGYVTGTYLVDDSGSPRVLFLSAWVRGGNGRQDNYFTNEPFYENVGRWRHNPPIYVPMQSSYDILGYSSQLGFDDGDVLWGYPNNAQIMRLTIGPTHLQDDVLYGAAFGIASGMGHDVTLQMYHAQAWIEVVLRRKAGAQGAEAIVTSVVLEKLYTGCEVTVNANGGVPSANCRTRQFAASDHVMGDPVGLYGCPVTEEGGSLRMLVPEQQQTFLVVNYEISGVDFSSRYELPHAYWLMGKHYLYEIVFDPLTETFVVAGATVEPWTVGNTYSERI